MTDYTAKTYGRNAQVDAIYQMFAAGRDVAMPGPRRLGKTFVLDRIVDAGAARGWNAVKVDVAGCTDARLVFRRLCEGIGKRRTGGARAISLILQRLGQVLSPRSDPSGPWYQPLLSLDYETMFERLLGALNRDPSTQWAVLIDELPIFLKALHDRGPDGVAQALSFMNLMSRLREANSGVRWLITGSIGIEPLARAGNYMGVLAKFHTYELEPLTTSEANDYVQDLASEGQLANRKRISPAEAAAIVAEVGWRAPFYLEALANKMRGEPSDDADKAAEGVGQALALLVQPGEVATFGIWEEHIRKHYRDVDRGTAFKALARLAPHSTGLSVDSLLAGIGREDLKREQLIAVITRLHVEGFLTVQDWDGSNPNCAFRNPLLRLWWKRYPPQSTD